MNDQHKDFSHHPLLCWDIASDAFFRRINFREIAEFKKAHKSNRWNFELPDLYEREFEAIILTDPSEKILWASPGFKTMTGYNVKFAIGKQSSFLQGKDTDAGTKSLIRSALNQHLPITTTLINYRNDGVKYYCHVDIHPLYSPKGELVNFMALEKEAKHQSL